MMGTPRVKRRLTPAGVVSWTLRVALALAIGGGGIAKLVGEPTMVEMFDTIGSGQGLRYLVGALEVAGAVGLLVPPLTFAASAGLTALLLGAAVTNITTLDISPALPLVYLGVAVVIGILQRPSWLRRRGRARVATSVHPRSRGSAKGVVPSR